MSKGRKTTFEEHVEIMLYCVFHTHYYVEMEKNKQSSMIRMGLISYREMVAKLF